MEATQSGGPAKIGRAERHEHQRRLADPDDVVIAQFFGADDNFLAEALWEYLKLQHPMAVTREVSTEKALKGAIAVYEAGVYMSGQCRRFNLSVTRALGDRYRLVYTETVAEIALNELTYERAVIPERMDRLLVNCRNGLVDVMTGELFPMTPAC